MTDDITYYPAVAQGSDEWRELRRGMLTASEMNLILTPKTLQYATGDKERAHLWELLAQRISGHMEEQYVSDAMLRGKADEELARQYYEQDYDLVDQTGFVVNRSLGFPIGYSPDGLVGKPGLIECKSRDQRFQIETIVEHLHAQEGKTIPFEFRLQVQTGLWVTKREWLDFLSYSNGLHMACIRVYPDLEVQDAIVSAAKHFESRLQEKRQQYEEAIARGVGLTPTLRVNRDMIL